MTARTRPGRPRLATALPRLEMAAEQSRAELGYRAAIAMEIEHARPDLVRESAIVAARIGRARQAAAFDAAAAAYGRQPVVYLLHFTRRYQHAGHYCGWTDDLAARLARHAAGDGARLLAVIRQAGITWSLARVWPGPRERERQLKRQGGASRRCPVCRAVRVDTAGGRP